eukprot:365308-Chlamydomonas_euryale.AAC.5
MATATARVASAVDATALADQLRAGLQVGQHVEAACELSGPVGGSHGAAGHGQQHSSGRGTACHPPLIVLEVVQEMWSHAVGDAKAANAIRHFFRGPEVFQLPPVEAALYVGEGAGGCMRMVGHAVRWGVRGDWMCG